jgi:triphosphoribosyl-dephospho-CoA synthase
MNTLSLALAADAFRLACRYDVLAFKPGNVSVEHSRHGMTARDFLSSARVASEPACRIGDGMGASIRAAVNATIAEVGCNTNLGIILLSVPLLHAALKPHASRALAPRLQALLAATTVADADAVFAAIRRAQPAGLGKVTEEDVHAPASKTLRDVMTLAAAHDCIAAQYADGYAAVFARGVPVFEMKCRQGACLSVAMTDCFFAFLTWRPDTHIARKWGAQIAASVQQRAQAVESALKACEDPSRRTSILSAFDNELKSAGVNPGTSADLTVASLLAWLLDTALNADSSGTAPPYGLQANGH